MKKEEKRSIKNELREEIIEQIRKEIKKDEESELKREIIKKVKKELNEDDDSPGGLFIPAGVLGGMGFGFLYNNLIAGLFIGLGTGFALFAIYEIIRSIKKK